MFGAGQMDVTAGPHRSHHQAEGKITGPGVKEWEGGVTSLLNTQSWFLFQPQADMETLNSTHTHTQTDTNAASPCACVCQYERESERERKQEKT